MQSFEQFCTGVKKTFKNHNYLNTQQFKIFEKNSLKLKRRVRLLGKASNGFALRLKDFNMIIS